MPKRSYCQQVWLKHALRHLDAGVVLKLLQQIAPSGSQAVANGDVLGKPLGRRG